MPNKVVRTPVATEIMDHAGASIIIYSQPSTQRYPHLSPRKFCE